MSAGKGDENRHAVTVPPAKRKRYLRSSATISAMDFPGFRRAGGIRESGLVGPKVMPPFLTNASMNAASGSAIFGGAPFGFGRERRPPVFSVVLDIDFATQGAVHPTEIQF